MSFPIEAEVTHFHKPDIEPPVTNIIFILYACYLGKGF